MIHVPAPDPFTVFGLPRSLDLDERALEQRYLKLSRECHPDLNRTADISDCIAVLQRSAEINDAWKLLRDPWSRAKALLETVAPGALDRNKTLDPTFLGEALELAEEVAECDREAAPALRERLRATLTADYEAVREALTAGKPDVAASRCHKAHYHKKALQDLEAKS